ncbi:YhgE/Pip domain-containing protein [Ectobacillus ponti]|uniref:YhgE/Pip domain-containing protein n=1 Tax=Ectobacillus ponti TaxID=2961894 RepID=A0AA41X2R7_9BACI|nr:YhgE/Pip domain-containing protein [Ectobacillus ponti]
MGNIWHVYRNDWKSILMVLPVTLLVAALAILPSVYAWVNIKSMWDPYSNTSGIPIAVTNEDEGAEVRGKHIRVGGDVIEKLKHNKNLGWVFVDRKQAERGVRHGEYYASLLIPKDFSRKLSSILEQNPQKPNILFSVNEKINAVTPKITKSGASNVTAQVEEAFVENVGHAVLTGFQQAGVKLEQELPAIQEVKRKIFALEKALPEIEAMGQRAIELEGKLPDIRQKGQQILVLEQRIPDLDRAGASILKVEQALPQMEAAGGEIVRLQEQLAAMQQAPSIVADMEQNLAAVEARLQESMAALQQSGENVASLAQLREQLAGVRKDVAANQDALQQRAAEAVRLIGAAGTFMKEEWPAAKAQVQRAAGFVRKDLPKLEQDIHRAADLIRTKLPAAESAIHKAADFARNDLPKFEQEVRGTAARIREFDKGVDLNRVIDFLKHDPEKHSTFLANAVALDTKRIFPIPNYGSAMAPFYTMLALWVGATLLVASLRVEVEDPEGKYRGYQRYFGRLFTFLTIGVCQALIVSLGDVFLLKTYVVDKPHFVLFSVFISLVFITITYTLCAVFGNIGKGMAIIFLVLQIASSGATFPVAMTSPFFQHLNPFMPFTYAISMLREAVGGVMWDIAVMDALRLCCFALLSFLLALLLKKPLAKRLQRTTERVRMTKIVP